jgi:hypothetical protein
MDELFELFLQSQTEPWPTFERVAPLLAARDADRASLLTVQRMALEAILEDLGEHGSANRDDYGGHPDAHFRAELARVKKTLAAIPDAERATSRCAELLRRFEQRTSDDVIAAIERSMLRKLQEPGGAETLRAFVEGDDDAAPQKPAKPEKATKPAKAKKPTPKPKQPAKPKKSPKKSPKPRPKKRAR